LGRSANQNGAKQAINQLRALESEGNLNNSSLFNELKGKIALCGGSIDVSGHLTPLVSFFQSIKSEHANLL